MKKDGGTEKLEKVLTWPNWIWVDIGKQGCKPVRDLKTMTVIKDAIKGREHEFKYCSCHTNPLVRFEERGKIHHGSEKIHCANEDVRYYVVWAEEYDWPGITTYITR